VCSVRVNSSHGVCVIGNSCRVVCVVFTTEERSLRHSHMCLARWRSSLLKNGMVTLWAAIYLRISLRRGERCWPPGRFNRRLVLRLSRFCWPPRRMSLAPLPLVCIAVYPRAGVFRLAEGWLFVFPLVCDALASLNEGVSSSGRLF